jgi:uncharacterized membrane protein YqgA involved in biofilm formation
MGKKKKPWKQWLVLWAIYGVVFTGIWALIGSAMGSPVSNRLDSFMLSLLLTVVSFVVVGMPISLYAKRLSPVQRIVAASLILFIVAGAIAGTIMAVPLDYLLLTILVSAGTASLFLWLVGMFRVKVTKSRVKHTV